MKPVAGSTRPDVEVAGGDDANDVTKRRRAGDGGLTTSELAVPLPLSAPSGHMTRVGASAAQAKPPLAQPSGSNWQGPFRSGAAIYSPFTAAVCFFDRVLD